jgi:trk system potassium uptake protein TrkA
VAILRDQAPITPSRDDVIDGGDELFFVTTIAAEDQLRELLSPGSGEGSGSDEASEGAAEAREPAAVQQTRLDQSPEDDGFDG